MTTASDPVCPRRAAVEFWLAVVPRADKNWHQQLVAKNKLPRKVCLKSRSEIDQLFATGRRFSSSGHACVWAEADQFRCAVFVSRRHGSAVVRNQIKRRYREAIRQVRTILDRPVKVGFIPNLNSAKSNFQQVYGEIRSTFEQISRSL